MSSQLAEFRARCFGNHQSFSPAATEHARVPPLQLDVTGTPVTSTCNLHQRTNAQTSNSKQQTPRISSTLPADQGKSAPSKLSTQMGTVASVKQSSAQVKRERLSISPLAPDASSNTARADKTIGQKHPLVTATKSVGHGQNEPLVTKQVHKQPSPAHRDTTLPYSGPSLRTKNTTAKSGLELAPKASESRTEDAGDLVAGSNLPTSSSVAEEARKKRQEQQKLQKEKWQKKHGQGVKRRSEGDLSSAGEGEGGVDAGATVDSDDNLISVGETQDQLAPCNINSIPVRSGFTH